MRITGKRAQMFMPANSGISLINQELIRVQSKTIQGVEYTNRFYATNTRTAWNRSKPITVRLQGIITADVFPGTTNNSVVVKNVRLYKNTTDIVSNLGEQILTLTRSSTNYQWYAIVVDESDATASAVAGTAGTAHVEQFNVAGGLPYIPNNKIMVAAIKLMPGDDAPISSSEIVYTLSNGMMLQERFDVPGFAVFPVEGGVLMNSELLACHTGGTTRKVFATFYDQYPVLIKVGDIEGWSLKGSSDTTEMEAAEDVGAQKDLSGSIKWSGSFTRFYVQDDRVWKTAMEQRTAIMRFFPDAADPTRYYEGAVIIKDWEIEAKIGDAIKEEVSFEGDGNLEFRQL